MPHDHAHNHSHVAGHHHHHHHLDPNSGDKMVVFAVALNIALTFAQVAGGLWAGSMALVADGVHNFSDAAALILAFGARRLARRGRDQMMTFGWSRAEVLAAFVNYIALILISLWLMAEAVGRLMDPPEVEGWTVLILAGLALVVDLGTAALTFKLSKDSINIRAAFLHNLADAGASIAVIVGGAVILIWDWRLVDPILTMLISVFILWHILGDLKPVTRILMLGAPTARDSAEVEAALANVAGVAQVHHLHLWQINEKRSSLEAHLVLEEGADYVQVIASAKAMLAQDFGLTHVTLEPESSAVGCADITADG
ncbi:cation transporter [Rhodobacteraceae bacterium]|nr:cation transporter [Paracoccaceae bacterium]